MHCLSPLDPYRLVPNYFNSQIDPQNLATSTRFFAPKWTFLSNAGEISLFWQGGKVTGRVRAAPRIPKPFVFQAKRDKYGVVGRLITIPVAQAPFKQGRGRRIVGKTRSGLMGLKRGKSGENRECFFVNIGESRRLWGKCFLSPWMRV